MAAHKATSWQRRVKQIVAAPISTHPAVEVVPRALAIKIGLIDVTTSDGGSFTVSETTDRRADCFGVMRLQRVRDRIGVRAGMALRL
jgi:hypothetical protein